ncbi:hypothetical protein Fcan01_26874 [Folsomia candida]|uniref:Uncharacterized protein n=1 Tax=Folsomia candida TaxID=158441 RepID=A0A226CZM6_FOLCA|nr:hypothetical protein Fcan01_26874 [Folsomia candida]
MSSSISRRSDQCKVHVVILKHSSQLSFPTVVGEDNGKTLIYIIPDQMRIPTVIIEQDWRSLIDKIWHIFVLNVDYDVNRLIVFRAFLQRQTHVLRYDPGKETLGP